MHVCVSRSFPIRKTTFCRCRCIFQFLSWRTFVLADLCPGGPVPAFTAAATFSVTVFSFDCSTRQFILLIIFCVIISAAPIKKCQKLGTYITTCQLLFWMQGRFCIYKFQNLPESRGNSPWPSSGRDNQYKLQVLFANPIHFSISYFHFSSC